ncbi:MAG: hypothetical protein H9L35_03345 [Acinetobacter sp.]|uniref:hypothetical protein n=1 Tax=Acinetobacter sp. TaxID=472 RepID=UPI0019AC5332|nr:hypothetical protein [Acinetobacter sp.]MBC6675281.1 hypothetical protein [Acinetobacter sp.]
MSLPPKLINTDQESDFLMNTDKTIETPQSPRISVAPMMDWTINLKYILNIKNL